MFVIQEELEVAAGKGGLSWTGLRGRTPSCSVLDFDVEGERDCMYDIKLEEFICYAESE